MKNAVAYFLKPGENQHLELSLDRQEQSCRLYCQRQGLELARTFLEEDTSTPTLKRSEWRRLMAYCKSREHQIRAIVLYSLAVLPLDNAQQVFNLMLYFKSRGITFHVIEELPGGDSFGRGSAPCPVIQPRGGRPRPGLELAAELPPEE